MLMKTQSFFSFLLSALGRESRLLGRFHSSAKPVRIRWPGRIGPNSSNGKTLTAVQRRPRAVAAPVTAPASHDRRSKAWPPFSVILGLALQGDAPFIMKNGQEAFDLAAVDHHHSGDHTSLARTSEGSSRPLLSPHRLIFPRRSPRFHENGLEAAVVDGSDLRSPPLDRPGFEICRSPMPSLPPDRWDSSLEAPIIGDAKADGKLSLFLSPFRFCLVFDFGCYGLVVFLWVLMILLGMRIMVVYDAGWIFKMKGDDRCLKLCVGGNLVMERLGDEGLCLW
ncbi:hypothetical protein GQ457_12G013900 [Hibiscus cannabinus]